MTGEQIYTTLSESSHRRLRKWAHTFLADPHPHVQARALILTSSAWRHIRFGTEKGILEFKGINLAIIASKLSPARCIQLLRPALIKSAIEDDAKTTTFLASLPELADTNAWIKSWIQESQDQVKSLLDNQHIKDHELLTARALVAKKHPMLIDESWISTLKPDEYTASAICSFLTSVVQHRPDLSLKAIEKFASPHVLFSSWSDVTISTIIDLRPELAADIQKILGHGMGDRSKFILTKAFVITENYTQAEVIGSSIRPLSRYFDQTMILMTMIYGHKKDRLAFHCMNSIDNALYFRQALVQCQNSFPNDFNTEIIAKNAISCTRNEPEVFYKFILALLNRGELERAKIICQTKLPEFHDNEIINSIIQKITGKS